MVDQILPKPVSVVSAKHDRAGDLFPEEEWVIRSAVEKRRREFTTARICAREALARVGISFQAIPAGPDGDPRWPAGIVGSITHCDGYRAAAVARAREFAAIGIDAEPARPLPDGVLPTIAVSEELAWIQRCERSQPSVCWDRLLFSIKETVYKAWFALTAQHLRFGDASVEVDHRSQCFLARIEMAKRSPASGSSNLSGRWLIRNDLVVTASVVPIVSSVGFGRGNTGSRGNLQQEDISNGANCHPINNLRIDTIPI